MSNADSVQFALVTAPDQKTAEAIAYALVERKIAACVNILPGLRSIYRWEEEVHDEGEVLMIIKTRKDLFDPELITCVQELHPYQVSEIIALPVIAGEKTYLDWILAETS
jgi:periplasmic divalent cation tolerance protein